MSKYGLAEVSGTPSNGDKIKLEDVEVPQYESLDEFVEAATSEVVALAFINKAMSNTASQKARNAINSADQKTTTRDKIISNARELARTAVPTDRTREGTSVKTRAEKGKEMAAKVLSGQTLTDDERAEYAKIFGVTL